MAYLTSEVSSVSDVDESVWDTIIDSSWDALEQNFPWELLSKTLNKEFTVEEKKEYLREQRNEHILGQKTQLVAWYNHAGTLVFYTWGDIDRDAGTVSIKFIAYGPDETGRKQYIVRDQLDIKKSSRRYMRAQGVQHMSFFIVDEDNSMHRHVNRYFVNHSVDYGDRTTVLHEDGKNGRINKYKLSDNVEDDELLD